MALYKTAVTPVLTHWSYCSLAQSHRYAMYQSPRKDPMHVPLPITITATRMPCRILLSVTCRLLCKPIYPILWLYARAACLANSLCPNLLQYWTANSLTYILSKLQFLLQWIHTFFVHHWNQLSTMTTYSLNKSKQNNPTLIDFLWFENCRWLIKSHSLTTS